MKRIFIVLTLVATVLVGCKAKKKDPNQKIKVVSTTTMLTDLMKNIGGDKIELHGLMGAGIDPHTYNAKANDTDRLFEADVIVYSGLHLESKLEDVFEKMNKQGKKVIVAGKALKESDLFEDKNFEGSFDPHIWHDTTNWMKITNHVAEKLAEYDTKNAAFYKENAKKYLVELEKLTTEVEAKVAELPVEKRIMVTAHDAFSYFGRQHNFKVVGLQGISTAAEAGVKDVQNLAKFIIEKKIKAIFVETSVNRATIESLQASVKDKEHEVEIGGTLYSDALGDTGTIEGTYIGMYKANINTIVNALK